MKIGVTTIAYNQAGPLLKMAKTITNSAYYAGHTVEFHLFLHSKVKKVIEACQQLKSNYRTVYHPYKVNRGVSRSWNDGILDMMRNRCDVMFIANDDIWVTGDDIGKMVDASVLNSDKWAITCSGWNDGSNKKSEDHGFSLIAINPIAIRLAGMFDENFFPAYNEDLDYVRRVEFMCGLERVHLKDTMVHHIGSATIKANQILRQQNHVTHGRNDDYWEKKWGAKKPSAVFTRPFNNRGFTAYIDPGNRHEPYPGYNRTDTDIVRI